jgi:hypothetical protein
MQAIITTLSGSIYTVAAVAFGLLEVTRASATAIRPSSSGMTAPGDTFMVTHVEVVQVPVTHRTPLYGDVQVEMLPAARFHLATGGIVTTSPMMGVQGDSSLIAA